jgi:hypothetical protein
MQEEKWRRHLGTHNRTGWEGDIWVTRRYCEKIGQYVYKLSTKL